MKHTGSTLPLRVLRTCTSCILAALLFILVPPGIASAQTALPAPSRPLGHTPAQVLDGRATLLQHYDPGKSLRVTIGLTPPHMDEERQLIDQLHDKKSPEFHKWLTPEQWDARFAPSVEDEQAVVDWARGQGLTVTNRFADRLLVDVVAPAGVIEKAFNITLNSYKMGFNTYFANDRDPQVPASLSHTIQSVMGLNSFLQLRPHNSASSEASPRPDFTPGPPIAVQPEHRADGSKEKLALAMKNSRARMASGAKPQFTNNYYDPTDLYSSQAYDTDALNSLGHCCNPYHGAGSPPESTIAIAAFADLTYSDVDAFRNQYSYMAENIQKIYIDGTYVCTNSPNLNYDNGCLEVSLDTEWSMAMANSFGAASDTAKVWVYEGASYGDIADVYNFMVSDGYAKVTSTSWGCTEFSCFDGPTMDSLDAIFSKMVGQGWTLIAAAGDTGATDGCTNGTAVDFPASDPNFIAAGGTTLSLFPGPYYYSEVAWTGATDSSACAQNRGGTGGGFSAHFAAPGYQSSFGYANRSLPDIALNANVGQNMYFAANGGLFGIGGTSIVAPELAGFFAQQNAYGLAIGNACGSGSTSCAPIGNANYYIYDEGRAQTAAHYPFYDITSGCNSNNITAQFNDNYYCAAAGFDQVSGWGSMNMLQLAWAINWYDAFTDGHPTITFTGPQTDIWFSSNQTISWTVNDNVGRGGSPTGIAGETQGWDSLPGDAYSETTPGTGDSFYSGPQIPNGKTGCLQLGNVNGCQGNAPQGCHYAYVQAWNNMGVSTGAQSYGPVCWDNVPPVTSIALSGSQSGAVYTSPVTVTITSTDATSGVIETNYTLDGAAQKSYGGPFTVSNGTHYLTAYSRDLAGNDSLVQAALFSVQSPTKTTLASTSNSIVYGNSVTLTATVAASFGGAPVGTVTFKNGGAALGTATLSSGKASLAVSTTLVAGSDSITAVYSGNSSDIASASSPLVVTVKQAATSTTLVSSANPVRYDAPVTFTASVKPATAGTPGGSITFKNGGVTLATVALNGGKATLTTSALTLGAHAITAAYGGSTDFIASTSPALSETVTAEPTTTTIASSANPSTYGEKFVLTVKVHSGAGTPAGPVTLKAGSTTVGTATLASGTAVFNLTSLSVGTTAYTAVYTGNTDFSASTSTVLDQVEKKASTTTTLASSLNPSTFGKSVTFTATVKLGITGTPTGTVTFKNGPTVLGTSTLASGKAAFTTTSLAVGAHPITATYNGNADYLASTSTTLTETVNKVATTTTLASSLNPSTFGKSVTFTATVKLGITGTPTGTVTFKNGSTVLGTSTLASGKAAFTTTSLAVGAHPITATYNGNADYLASTSTTLTETVNKVATTTTLASSLNPSTFGKSVTFTASVTSAAGVPAGTVAFRNGSVLLATVPLVSGKSQFKTTSLTTGSHAITATYNGNADDNSSKSTTLTEVVKQ